MPQQPRPQEPRRASDPLALALLVLVITFGIVFASLLAHQLVKRHHRLAIQSHVTQELRLAEQECPVKFRRVPYYHSYSDRFHDRHAAMDCPPVTRRWI
jgi:hypothetical protein